VPTKRGWATVGAAVALWIAARLVGSQDLHMVAAGVGALPLLAMAFVRWSHPRIVVHRQLSTSRAFAGARVSVTVSVENRGHATTAYLLLEDALPAALGSAARLVVTGIPPRNEHKVSYSILARHRGRYWIGPLSVYQTDPFGLARTKAQTTPKAELVVYPKVEPLDGRGLISQGAGSGDAAAKRLHRSAAEFYTMREYVTGDDLRRIHWPSVARTGTLMIRQDESTRRSSAVLLLDTRTVAFGEQGSPGFEAAVSAAASLGSALTRSGFAVRMGTVDAPPTAVTEEVLLDLLAGIGPSRTRVLAASLLNLRTASPADTTLAVITAPPTGPEVATLSRTGTAFGRKVVILIYPRPLPSLPLEAAAELEGRATVARASLQRAGWEVVIAHPEGKLGDSWRMTKTRKLLAAGSPS
jgi:uncharacterized protein (DUF58 family)